MLCTIHRRHTTEQSSCLTYLRTSSQSINAASTCYWLHSLPVISLPVTALTTPTTDWTHYRWYHYLWHLYLWYHHLWYLWQHLPMTGLITGNIITCDIFDNTRHWLDSLPVISLPVISSPVISLTTPATDCIHYLDIIACDSFNNTRHWLDSLPAISLTRPEWLTRNSCDDWTQIRRTFGAMSLNLRRNTNDKHHFCNQ